ncbi:MAG: RsmD family RNA methyltransferase [Candidatus Caldarchaeum sp.]|nr:RsmD family RNA methyltransferase [Candidatus Caldarchaeum sp.]
MDEPSKSFFLLSGEHPFLSAAELQHVLEIYGYGWDFHLPVQRVAVATTSSTARLQAVDRAAFTKMAGILLSYGRTQNIESGDVPFEDECIDRLPVNFRTFSVEVVKVGGVDVNSVEVEKKTAAKITSAHPGLRVCLENPDKIFTVVVSPEAYFFGVLCSAKPRKFFQQRRAGRKPFRLPSALQPKLARSLVNFSVSSPDSTVLDPFGGSGAILVEAGLMGHEVLGLELKTWICNGMAVNVSHYCPPTCHVIQGDAARMPFRKAFDSVATDPPYGRSTTLSGLGFKTLLERFFENLFTLLRPGGRVAIIVPRQEYGSLLDASKGFKPLQHHDIYVHKSLTRRVVVLKLE